MSSTFDEPRQVITFDAADTDTDTDTLFADRSPGRHQSERPSTATIAVLAAIVVLCAAGAAYLVSASQVTRYAAEIDILYDTGESSGSDQSKLLVDTQRVVLQGPAVLQPVADELGIPYDDLAAAVSTTSVNQSQVIRLRVTDADVGRAMAAAAAIAESYETGVNSDSNSALEAFLEDQVAVIQAQLDADRAELASLEADDAARGTLEARVTMLEGRLASFQDRIIDEQTATLAGRNARILGEVRSLTDPVSPRPVAAATFGTVAGAIVAIGMVLLLLQYRTRREQDR